MGQDEALPGKSEREAETQQATQRPAELETEVRDWVTRDHREGNR